MIWVPLVPRLWVEAPGLMEAVIMLWAQGLAMPVRVSITSSK